MSLVLLFHYLLLNMFRMLVQPSSGACDFLWIYFMCCIALVRCVLVLRCGSAGVVWYPYAGWSTSVQIPSCLLKAFGQFRFSGILTYKKYSLLEVINELSHAAHKLSTDFLEFDTGYVFCFWIYLQLKKMPSEMLFASLWSQPFPLPAS